MIGPYAPDSAAMVSWRTWLMTSLELGELVCLVGSGFSHARTIISLSTDVPSDFSKVVEFIPDNSQVTLIDFNRSMRNYYKANYNGSMGWVPGKNIRMTEEVKSFRKKMKASHKNHELK